MAEEASTSLCEGLCTVIKQGGKWVTLIWYGLDYDSEIIMVISCEVKKYDACAS